MGVEYEYSRAQIRNEWNVSIQWQENGMCIFKGRAEVWNTNIQGQEGGMCIFKDRSIECAYSRAGVWNVSFQGHK